MGWEREGLRWAGRGRAGLGGTYGTGQERGTAEEVRVDYLLSLSHSITCRSQSLC